MTYKCHNNDRLDTSVELQIGLEPYNPHDPYRDKDTDGLSDLFEYNNSLNMNDHVTDPDGINDCVELHYWNVTRNLYEPLQYERAQ